MRSSFAALVRLLALGAFACASSQPAAEEPAPGQSYEDALRLVCDVDRRAGIDGSDPLAASSAREDYLLAHVENPDGIYFVTIFRSKGGNEQAKLLANEAREHGITHCTLADDLRAAASGDADAPDASGDADATRSRSGT